MSDEDEIRTLQVNYAKYFDARDADRYADLYTEDTVVTTPWGQVIHGRDKMRKAVQHTPPGEGWHRPGDSVINVTGDTAEAVAHFEALDRDGQVNVGRYLDTYRRTEGGWRIASRQVIIDSKHPFASQPSNAPADP